MGQQILYDPSEIPGGSLNNFLGHFLVLNVPNPFPTIEEGLCRAGLKSCWNCTERNWINGMRIDPSCIKSYCADHSEKRLDQTPAEFYAEIDRTIVEVGLTVESVARKVNSYLGNRDCVDVALERAKALDAFLLPIYIALRNKGYSKQDLWG